MNKFLFIAMKASNNMSCTIPQKLVNYTKRDHALYHEARIALKDVMDKQGRGFAHG